MSNLVTVLTPTYNRRTLLQTLYESLCRQTRLDFQWLVVDDGSTDETVKYLKSLVKKTPFAFAYYKKENGGKHSALNFAHPYITGDVVVIVDSDDTLTPDAIETIETDWYQYGSRLDICGMSYSKKDLTGHNISITHPQDIYIDDHYHYRVNKSIKGERCETVRTELFKRLPFPEFSGERFMSEGWLWNHLARTYKTVYSNKSIYIYEYQEGGLTKSGRGLRMHNPYGMMENCRSFFDKRVCQRVQIKEMWLFWVYGLCAKLPLWEIAKKSGRPARMILNLPFGALLYFGWRKHLIEK